MAVRTLPRADWNAYFDRFSKTMSDTGRTDYAEIRVLSHEDGVQPETRRLTFTASPTTPRTTSSMSAWPVSTISSRIRSGST